MESNRIIMTIEINTKGTESFYREVVSVIAQYQNLLKEPSKKYKDIFKCFLYNIFLGLIYFLSMSSKFLILKSLFHFIIYCRVSIS